jgi:hypothetical protein
MAETDPRRDPAVIQALVRRAAAKHGVPEDVALAVVSTESSFNPDAQSEAGASGLMQLMPLIAGHYGVEDVFDPVQNLDAGMAHLSHLWNKYEGDFDKALTAYYAGEGVVDQNRPRGPRTTAYPAQVRQAMAQNQQQHPGGPPQGPLSSAALARNERLRSIHGPGEPPDTPGTEAWVYPTPEHATAARNSDDPGDPSFQGVLISYDGPPVAQMTPQQQEAFRVSVGALFRELNPAGAFTREDAPTLAALGTSVAAGTKQFARGGRALAPVFSRVAKLSPWGRFGIPIAAGVGAAAGEGYRQSQIPTEVEGLRIVSWPRRVWGIPYEGAPNTPTERASAALLKGAVEGLMEVAGSEVGGAVLRKLGDVWKGSAFSSPSVRSAMDAADKVKPPSAPTARQRITHQNALPTKRHADDLQTAAVAAARAADELAEGLPDSAFSNLTSDVVASRARGGLPASRLAASPYVPGHEMTSLLDDFIEKNTINVPGIRRPATPGSEPFIGGFGRESVARVPPTPAIPAGPGQRYARIHGSGTWNNIRKLLNQHVGELTLNPNVDNRLADQYRLLANAIREETAERLGSQGGAAYRRHLSNSHNLNELGGWVRDQSRQGWGGLAAGWFGASALGALAPLYGGYGQGPSDLLQAGIGAGLGTQFTSGGRARLGGLLTRAGVGPNVANLFRGLSAGLSSAPRTQNLSPQNALPPAPQTTPPVNPPAGVPLGSLRGGVRRRQQLPVGAGPTPIATTPLGSPENPLELTLTSSPQARRRRPGR